MQKFPWVEFIGLAGGLMGVGYLLMSATTPTESQLYAKMAPDLRRHVDATRAARLAREAEIQGRVANQTKTQEDPETQGPIWADASKTK